MIKVMVIKGLEDACNDCMDLLRALCWLLLQLGEERQLSILGKGVEQGQGVEQGHPLDKTNYLSTVLVLLMFVCFL